MLKEMEDIVGKMPELWTPFAYGEAMRQPRGRYAHLTDALGYPLWWATPKPGEAGGWDASDIRIVRARPRPESW